GPNGAGKSTLLALMAGELRPVAEDDSRCRLLGEEYWCLDELRERIGFVTPGQNELFHDDEIASDVVLTGLRGAYGRTTAMRFSKRDKRRAWKAMSLVGVQPLIWRRFGELSSGERRRFLLARALVHGPEFLVLDEPASALDLPGAWKFFGVIRELVAAGTGLLLVTHDAREIPPEVRRVVLLKEGGILADGPKRKVMTPELLGACYGLPVKVKWSGGFCEVRPG
ncbi:MAG: ATP-binding cassette domain-containing protein, partial [Akkermansiaceae bacterium]|nr:ATP-binding cassette domain-containing protein [Akkermansiaceae bacterium]